MIHGNAVIILHIFSLFLFFFMLYTFKYTLGVCRYACLIYNQMKKKKQTTECLSFLARNWWGCARLRSILLWGLEVVAKIEIIFKIKNETQKHLRLKNDR